jgi:multiple sugar transport system ATP-binding protein
MARVVFKNVTKIFGRNTIGLKNFSLEVPDKSFVVLVGPSGCGKSTALRLVAGLDEPTDGKIYIGQRLANNLSPKERDVAMVFQNYALYPHMSVLDNMAFGLKLRKYRKDHVKDRVEETAKILGIEELLNRKPKALSGGQRQRVALGRAIVREPKVFLFDEPLSNLDAKLRVQMRTELLRLHQKLQSTVIYVTHDQVEALTMGEVIVILRAGITQQVADPLTLYNRPANLFIAGFIGSPSMNFLQGRIEGQEALRFVGNAIDLRLPDSESLKNWAGRPIVLGIRPEDIFPATTDTPQAVRAKVEVVEPIGEAVYLHLKIGASALVARFPPDSPPKLGETVRIWIDLGKAHYFDLQTEKRIE